MVIEESDPEVYRNWGVMGEAHTHGVVQGGAGGPWHAPLSSSFSGGAGEAVPDTVLVEVSCSVSLQA